MGARDKITSPKDEATKNKYAQQRYNDRLAVLRLALEYSQKEDLSRAVSAYKKYLESLSLYFEVEEEDLRPELFQKDNNVAEILLISQVYWDLAKTCDRSQRLQKESERCLRQFVRFSLGFKFQFINSEMIRKFIKKKSAYNPQNFEKAYQQLRVNSKKCYVATHCFGEDHEITNNYRKIKPLLEKSSIGQQIINFYYSKSPLLITFLESNPMADLLFTRSLIKPLMTMFSKVFLRYII